MLSSGYQKAIVETDGVFLMAESIAYFEASRYVLTGIQTTFGLPLQQYIVDCTPDVDAPAYLRTSDVKYNFSCIMDKNSLRKRPKDMNALVLYPTTWPDAQSLGLNDSQFKALHTALTKELALIQGPPGTGKTYVGLKIAKILLENKDVTKIGPILVVCYTNHALDQFLEGIFAFQNKGIVRVGGRSNSEILKNCSFFDYVKKFKRKGDGTLYRELNQAKDELKDVVRKLKECNLKLFPERDAQITIEEDLLKSLVKERDGFELPFNEAMLRWLNLFSDNTELNEKEFTVLVESHFGELFTKQQKVDNVSLAAGRDYWIMALVKTSFGGGIISTNLKKKSSKKSSQTLFIDSEGYLTYINASKKRQNIMLQGNTEINDDEWHEVIIAFEEKNQQISMYVDKNLEAEQICPLTPKSKEDKENVYVGSNPFPDEPQKNEVFIKKIVYFPNTLPILNVNITEDQNESDTEQVQLVSEVDFLQSQRLTEGDNDVEGFIPQTKQTKLEKILQQDRQGASWSLVRNKENDNARFASKIRQELQKKDCMSNEEMAGVKDVWNLKEKDRWRLYRRWRVEADKEYHWQMAVKQTEYERAVEAVEEDRCVVDAKCLKNASVIGMTTTGAAKRSKLIREVGARVVIVEEAAEVLEAHIVTSLTNECKHLILIGDHQQLRPSPNVYNMVKTYNFDVSLFERMIKNGLDYQRLKKQHRMRPEISQIIRHIYPDLEDHESVLKFENIAGIKNNIYFIHHEELEVHEQDTLSHANKHEAKFVVFLCKYLLQQGYKSSQITILTPYTGQLREIQKCANHVLLSRKGEPRVRVTSIDNYQGEENDIILLSLVRSNEKGIVGFVKTDNRICVALSRAKKGLYCIGNMEMMQRKSNLWRRILTDMKAKGLVGRKLTLCCQVHENKIEVETVEDFKRAPNGGCVEICMTRLPCGHSCNKKCHPIDTDHEYEYRCIRRCDKIPCLLHPEIRCRNRCSDKKCSPCQAITTKVMLGCEHEQVMFCHQDPSEVKCTNGCRLLLDCGHQCPNLCSHDCGPCTAVVTKSLPDCDHEAKMLCSEDAENYDCRVDCTQLLPCNHRCRNKCFQTCGPCMVKCIKTLPGCGHQIATACYKKLSSASAKKCKSPCKKTMSCGHQCDKLCGDLCNTVCNMKCPKLLRCGHSCPASCSSVCPPCKVPIEVVLPCDHTVRLPCFQDPGTFPCSGPCPLILDCGHKCSGYCSRKCTPCSVLVSKRFPECGHRALVPCSTSLRGVLCQAPCEKVLPECGHNCEKKCHESCSPCMKVTTKLLKCNHRQKAACSEPESKILCKRTCQKVLPCGHSYTKICSDRCQPCQRTTTKMVPGCGHMQEMSCSTKPETFKCQNICEKVLPDCGHTCEKKCFEQCYPCQKRVPKEIPRCGHMDMIKCSTSPEDFLCKSPSLVTHSCGHSYQKICSEPTNPCSSSELVTKVIPSCGHSNKIPCNQNPANAVCTQSVHFPLLCGHSQSVKCRYKIKSLACVSKNCRKTENMKCGKACAKCLAKKVKLLPCGHKASVVCYKYEEDVECLSCSTLFMQ